MSDQWAILKAFDTTIEAHVAKGLLDQEGIPSVMDDVNMAATHNPGIGGVKLRVPSDQLERALALITSAH